MFGAAFLCLFSASSHALSTGRDRLSAETPHFFITAERDHGPAATEAADRLEAAFQALTAFFEFTPSEKISAVLVDDEDFSNGFAYAANAWIVLYLPPSRFDLRGSAAWLPNVSAHELTHIITLRKMGLTSRFLGLETFASLGFSRGRADASATWLPDDVPPWLAEGLAQYGSMHCGFDTLDSRRGMLLREAWKSDALLPLKAMEDFSGDGRGGEMVYNQGFHLVDFLYRTRGRAAVNAMLKAWNSRGYNGAFREAFGASPAEIYGAWRKELDETFGAQGLTAEASGKPVYRVEAAPVRDTARGILYFLSSGPNDFGITHLYMRRGNRARRIRLNVPPPLQLAADGSLLFVSVRIDPRTGARIGDLYRYLPDKGSVQRVTRGLRAFAGAQAGPEIYALVHGKGRTRLAHLKKGRPDRWIDAPAGSEFSAVTTGDDTTLYLAAVRGGNSDILRLNLRTGILSAAEASRHNEIDPAYRDGRLYFASDRSGEYAVYSRRADTLYRHTPAGVSAFQPFAAGDSLWYSAYGPGGFRLESAGLPADSALDAPPDTSNAPFAPATPTTLKRLGYDRAGMEWAGYFATLGYARTPSADVSGFFDSDASFRLNPCGQQLYAGGGALAADPAGRGSLTLAVLAAQCADGTAGAGPYLPYASLQYVSRNLAPDLIFAVDYQALQVGRLEPGGVPIGAVHQFQGVAAAQYHLGDYFATTPFAEIAGAVADLRGGETGGGGGLAAGNTFGFAVLEPGVDFINQGFYGDATALLSGPVGLFTGDAGAFANVRRALFLSAQADALQTTESAGSFDGGFLLSADARAPLGFTAGAAGYHGLFFESLFLRTGYARRWNTSTGVGLSLGNGLRPPAFGPRRYAAAPVLQARIQPPQTVRLGLRLKAISPGSRVVYWDLDWQAPPDGLDDGYLSFSLSL